MSTLDDLTEQEQRLISADFAEHVLPLFEDHYPDDRPRKSIDAARAYARGEITKEQLATARDAARAAARDAAGDAAGGDARDAAWAAAGAAAMAAAEDAARAAAEALAEVSARSVSAAAANALEAVRLEAENNIEIAARTKKARMDAGWAATVAEHKWQKQEFLRVVTETENGA